MEKKVVKKKIVLGKVDISGAVGSIGDGAVVVPKIITPEKKGEKFVPKIKHTTSMGVLFKVEGHPNYRFSQFGKKEYFDTYLAHPAQNKHPKVIEKKWFVIDFINGTITEEK